MERNAKTELVSITLLVGVAGAVYLASLQNGFVYDDFATVVYNDTIRNWSSLLSSITLYRYTRWVTFVIDYQLWGLNPLGYHLTNTLLHIACTVLVYRIAFRLFDNRSAALFGALVFAVHPVATEAVCNISNRNDLLATLFVLAAVLVYIQYHRVLFGKLVVAGLFGLALLSKESVAVTLPVLLLAYEFHFREPRHRFPPSRLLIKGYLPLLLLLAVHFGVLASSTSVGVAERAAEQSSNVFREVTRGGTSIWSIPGFAIMAFAKYWQLFLIPHGFSAAHPYPHLAMPFDSQFLLALGVAAVYIGALVWFIKKRWDVTFGLMWVGIAIFPVVNLIPITPHFVAERYAYAALVGLSLGAAWIAAQVANWFATRQTQRSLAVTAGILGGAIVVTLAGATIERSRDWESPYTLWSSAIVEAPESWTANYNLGMAYGSRQKLDSARMYLHRAIEIAPDEARGHLGLAGVYLDAGRLDEAEREYHACLRLDSAFAGALLGLGMVHMNRGDFDTAVSVIERALMQNRNFAKGYAALGRLYTKLGQYEKAEATLTTGIAMRPSSSEVHLGMAQLHLARGEGEAAMRELKTAVALDPNSVEGRCELGKLYLERRQGEQAIRELDAAVALDPNSANAHFYLGNAYSVEEMYDKAAAEYRETIHLRPSYPYAYQNLGVILNKKGLLEQANECFRKASALLNKQNSEALRPEDSSNTETPAVPF